MQKFVEWAKEHSAGKFLLCAGLFSLSTWVYVAHPEFNQGIPMPGGTWPVSAILMAMALTGMAYYFMRGAVTFALNVKRTSGGLPPVTQAALDGEVQQPEVPTTPPQEPRQ